MNNEAVAILDAYREAWEIRSRTGETNEALLTDVLRRRQVPSAWVGPGPARELLTGFWNEGVPPGRLRRSMIRTIPSLVSSAASPLVGILGLFEGDEAMDLTWMTMPDGHRALSQVRRANDLVLRYLHRRVDDYPLIFKGDPAGDDVLRRGLLIPPINKKVGPAIKVWLRMRSMDATADVMVGWVPVGSAVLPHHAWAEMTEQARRRIYADGTLNVGPAAKANGPVHVSGLRCYLPRVPR